MSPKGLRELHYALPLKTVNYQTKGIENFKIRKKLLKANNLEM